MTQSCSDTWLHHLPSGHLCSPVWVLKKPAFEVVLAKGWKGLNRDLSFLLEATKGLAQCNMVSLCVFLGGCVTGCMAAMVLALPQSGDRMVITWLQPNRCGRGHAGPLFSIALVASQWFLLGQCSTTQPQADCELTLERGWLTWLPPAVPALPRA